MSKCRDDRDLVHCTDRLPRELLTWMKAESLARGLTRSELHRQLLELGRRAWTDEPETAA